MARIYNHSGNEVPILHFQGKSRYVYRNFISEFQEKEINFPKGISIITFCNAINLPYAPLIKQLDKNKIPYANPAVEVIEWNHALKLEFLLKAIDNVKNDYVLALDSLDVVLTDRVAELLKRYRTYNKKVLFGATKNNFPNSVIDIIPNRDWLGEFRYLNAGTCIGERDAVKRFYEKAAATLKEIANPVDSEQSVIRTVFADMQNEAGFDYKCECFQTFSKAKLSLFKDEYSWQVR